MKLFFLTGLFILTFFSGITFAQNPCDNPNMASCPCGSSNFMDDIFPGPYPCTCPNTKMEITIPLERKNGEIFDCRVCVCICWRQPLATAAFYQIKICAMTINPDCLSDTDISQMKLFDMISKKIALTKAQDFFSFIPPCPSNSFQIEVYTQSCMRLALDGITVEWAGTGHCRRFYEMCLQNGEIVVDHVSTDVYGSCSAVPDPNDPNQNPYIPLCL